MLRISLICCLWIALVCALAGWPCAWAQGQPPANAASPAPLARQTQPTITEEDLRQRLLGKTLYLRGGYLHNSLNFDQSGRLIDLSPRGSFTLCLVHIDKVRFTRRKVELVGARYGLHFLGLTPYENPARAFDTVNITPRKKPLRITIAREPVVVPKKKKHHPSQESSPALTGQSTPAVDVAALGSATTATSQAIANQVLDDALHRVLAQSLDEPLIDTMPDFWQLYYKGIAAHKDMLHASPGVFLQSDVDQKARLLTRVQPSSNEYAQANGVAGLALYRMILGADGHPQQVAISRPIGFGLDENAVDAIRKASYQPAVKDGKPVPVLLDVLVEFRIYSRRTAATAPQPATAPATVLPGPYSAEGRP